ncbi:MAG TPA: hypothetical protein ENJ35_01880 [Gammaproteobacteria bacterium]|nr:hypothetical protein [Gammaproteobacteria bacterium]
MPAENSAEAIILMDAFAKRTGLISGKTPQRYLWTDAFAVCNFIGLFRASGERKYLELALQLVDQVHRVLGRYRDDDWREGWISGLSEKEGREHPTIGGLRIGKPLPERKEDEAYDDRLEWDRDGQYFHYLIQWMHALDRLGWVTGDSRYNRWACELAATAHQAFVRRHDGPNNAAMVWKMSTDLSRVLVPSMGQHDPLDGYVMARQLRSSAAVLGEATAGVTLDTTIHDYRQLLDGIELVTTDPLGIGGLLVNAFRLVQIEARNMEIDLQLLERLLAAAYQGLVHYSSGSELATPAEYRLAFRELGLAIGLQAVDWLMKAETASSSRRLMEQLAGYSQLGEQIVSFWRDPAHRRVAMWRDHVDINEVMLATCLIPGGFLGGESLNL